MKDHIKVTRDVSIMCGDPQVLIEGIRSACAGLKNVQYDLKYDNWISNIQITGWRPMTEEELIKAKEERRKERARRKKAKEAKEARERAEYERLKKKFEGE